MRSLDELTMYAYGLLEQSEEPALRHHVESCDACAAIVRRLGAERKLFERAAAPAEPAAAPPNLLRPRRARRPTLPGLAAARLLLAVLAWLLFRAPRVETVAPPIPALRGEDDLDRLVAELKSPSPVRRELAALALKAYGGLAVGKLEKAGAALELIDACRGTTPEMRAVIKKLDTMKIDLNFEKTPFEEARKFIRDFAGVPIIIDAAAHTKVDPALPVTIRAKGETLGSVLDRIVAPHGLKAMAIPEGVILITEPAKEAKALSGNVPVKVSRTDRNLSKEFEALGSDSPADRDRATATLRRLGGGTVPLGSPGRAVPGGPRPGGRPPPLALLPRSRRARPGARDPAPDHPDHDRHGGRPAHGRARLHLTDLQDQHRDRHGGDPQS